MSASLLKRALEQTARRRLSGGKMNTPSPAEKYQKRESQRGAGIFDFYGGDAGRTPAQKVT